MVLGTSALTAYLVADLLHYERERDAKSVELGRQAGVRVAEALDARLSGISRRAERFATGVPEFDDEEELLEAVRAASLEVPLLLGVTVAFEPGRYSDRDRYAPFFNTNRDEFQFVEESYDYTDPALETARWYTRIVATGEAGWSAPYYAEAADAMVVDYGVPFFDAGGELAGVVDYAIT